MTMTKFPADFDNTFVLVFQTPNDNSEFVSEAKNYVQQCVGYAARSVLSLYENLTPEHFTWEKFKDYKFVTVSLDTTKADRYPTSEFFEKIQEYLDNGSPAYKRARNGKPAGFQLIAPMYNKTMKIEKVFVDVDENGNPLYEEDMDNAVKTYVGRIRTLAEPTPEQVEQSFEGVTPGEDLKVTVPTGAKRITITIEF